jgi:hypothetical protein
VPPNEESQTIHMATAPQTTPEGRFFSENVVESDFLPHRCAAMGSHHALYAGTYWWIVGTQDRDSFLSRFSRAVGVQNSCDRKDRFRPAERKLVYVRPRRPRHHSAVEYERPPIDRLCGGLTGRACGERGKPSLRSSVRPAITVLLRVRGEGRIFLVSATTTKGQGAAGGS